MRLTEAEFQLLAILVASAGRALSRDRLLTQLTGRDRAPTDRTVDVLTGRLRKKLGENPSKPRMVVTVRGSGYLFNADVTREPAE